LSINKSVFSNAIIGDIDLEYENKVKETERQLIAEEKEKQKDNRER